MSAPALTDPFDDEPVEPVVPTTADLLRTVGLYAKAVAGLSQPGDDRPTWVDVVREINATTAALASAEQRADRAERLLATEVAHYGNLCARLAGLVHELEGADLPIGEDTLRAILAASGAHDDGAADPDEHEKGGVW